MSRQGKQRDEFLAQKMGILLLAAGYSRRFGGDKRRASISASETLLEATLQTLLCAGLPLRVCLRDEVGDREWARTFPRPVQSLFCGRSSLGMGATLAEGIGSCGDWDVTLVALADMPRIKTATLQMLAVNASPALILAPRFLGQRGHPVAFGRHFYEAIKALDGDSGAQKLFNQHADRVRFLDVSDPGVRMDVDTRDAMEALSSRK